MKMPCALRWPCYGRFTLLTAGHLGQHAQEALQAKAKTAEAKAKKAAAKPAN